MIKAIKGKYTVCCNQDKCIGIKILGQLPAECMAPLYFYSSLDLFGPFQVRDTVEHRVRRKVYGVVFTRLSSRSVHLELAKGYDTESSVKVLIRYCSVRGFPRNVSSDNATQLFLFFFPIRK